MKITKKQLKQVIKEELSQMLSEISRREQLFKELLPHYQNSPIEKIHTEADAAREAGDDDKADALDDIADHLDIQKDMVEPRRDWYGDEPPRYGEY